MAPNASPILLVFLFAGLVALRAQQTPPAVPEWQAAAGGKLAFEVASVKPSTESEFRGPVSTHNGD